MKLLASLVCMALLLLLSGGSASADPKAENPARNLLGAIKLWGDVRFFDPQIADGSVDWDAAFMNAEPAILAADTPQAYRAAIASMLASLRDPATHVDDASSTASKRISAAKVGKAVVITVPHGVSAADDQLTTDTASAVDLAAKSDVVAIDLRGVTEANAGDAAALRYLLSSSSPLLALVTGSITFPRERSRSYLGYPRQSSLGYDGYSGLDFTTDSANVVGTSDVHRRFVFLVDAATSLPSMALALAEAGDATIVTAGGSPAMLASSISEIEMPYGVHVTYRTGDLPDFGQPLHLPTASSPEEAIAKSAASSEFEPSAPRAAGPMLKDKTYGDVSFPAEPMRMLAIARIYNVIRYFSPYVNLMHDDWNAAALQAIDDEAKATDARSYVLGLMQFYAHLHDSHGYVRGNALRLEFGASVPFQARYLHRQVVVTKLASGSLRSGTLQVGDVIDAVNGVPVRQAMTEIEKYLCSSTEQSADLAALASAMQPSVFTGKKGTPINITSHRLHGKRQTITLSRDWFGFGPDRSGPKYFLLPGNVGYVDMDRIAPSEVDAMFEKLKNTRAIVFDNRGYPRAAAWAIVPRLTVVPVVKAALFDTPLVTQPLDAPMKDEDVQFLPNRQEFYQLLSSADGSKYLKPTVMLIDERAMSQSEHSALFFEAAARTRFVGTPTSGANGDVTSMVVPGGIALNFSGEGVRHANGAQLQRVGIIPDVRVEPTAADIASANDVVLQRGLEEALLLTGSTAQFRTVALQEEVAREKHAFTTPSLSQALAASGQNAQALKLAWVVNNKTFVGTTTAGGGYLSSDELTLASSGGGGSDVSIGSGSFAGPLDLESYRGKTVRIRGYLSTQDVKGGAGFWLLIDGPSREVDIMQDRWLTGSSDWKPFAIVLRVPVDATQAYSGLILNGTGTAHASLLTIDVVPNGTPTTGF